MSTPLENAYMQDYANSFFPPDIANSDLPELVQMRPGAMDGEMKAIEQTGLQKVMEQTGLTLEEIGKGLEGLGSVKIGGFEISLRDILPFVGSSEKKIDPVTGEETVVQTGTPAALQQLGQGVSATTGTGFARQLRPDMKAAAFDALDLAGVAKVATTGVKAAAKALAPKAAEMAEDFLTKRGMLLQFGPNNKQVEIPAAPRLETPAFKNWFGDSKVVDDQGKPLVVYHGTMNDFDVFGEQADVDLYKKMGLEQDGVFFFAKSPEIARTYTNSTEQGANIKPAYISLKNPLIVDANGARYDAGRYDGNNISGGLTQDAIGKAFDGGYDGVIIKNVRDDVSGGGDPTDVFISFKREQIKSVFNKGTWNPNDPRMSYGVGAGGAGAASQQEDK
jgi:hypothetical protein